MSRGLGDVYKRQSLDVSAVSRLKTMIAIAENSKFLWVETK